MKQLTINKKEIDGDLIDELQKGDLFGEIGLLTKLRRTCTVVTKDLCLMMTLTSEGMKNIEGDFPSIFDNISNNMTKYNDKNTCKRIMYV